MLFFVICYALGGVCCPFEVMRCLLFVVRCLLLVVWCALCVGGRVLFFAVYSPLSLH